MTWNACNVTCGSGTETATILCVNQNSKYSVDLMCSFNVCDKLITYTSFHMTTDVTQANTACSGLPRPNSTRTCTLPACVNRRWFLHNLNLMIFTLHSFVNGVLVNQHNAQL